MTYRNRKPACRHAAALTTSVVSAGLLIASLATAGPIDAPILPGGIAVEVSDVLLLPPIAPVPEEGSTPSLTKINFMREAPDQSGRLFINDLRGQLYVVDAGVRSDYMDLGAELPSGQTLQVASLAGGFVSFAFHPDFANVGEAGFGKFYTVHSEDGSATGPTPLVGLPPLLPGDPGTDVTIRHQSVITEWTTSDPSSNSFAGTPREVLRLGALRNAHPIGDLLFDADGLMYVAVGDGRTGSFPGDRPDLPGRLDSLLGSILRIDPLDPAGPDHYSIPASNPHVGDAGARGEIYARGFRNPHRLAHDPDTGVLLVSDIGEDDVEEVNIVHAGGNYGWSEREGTFTRGGGALPGDDAANSYLYPVAQYDHDEGFAIAGGFVYRGAAVPQLDGMFVFGDLVNGRVFYSSLLDLMLADDNDPTTTADIFELELLRGSLATSLQALVNAELGAPAGRVDLRFAQTGDGELFLISKQDGWIRSLQAAVPVNAPAALLLVLVGVGLLVSRRFEGAERWNVRGNKRRHPRDDLQPRQQASRLRAPRVLKEGT